MAPITDFNKAQSRCDLTSTQGTSAENYVEVKRPALKRPIHTDVPPLALLDEAAHVDIIKAEQLRQLSEQAATPAVHADIGQTTVEIAQLEMAKESAGRWPTADLVLNKIENYHVTIGIEVAWPLFQGGVLSSREREAAANVEKALGNLETARAQAAFEASQATLGVQSGNAMNRALKRALASNEV